MNVIIDVVLVVLVVGLTAWSVWDEIHGKGWIL